MTTDQAERVLVTEGRATASNAVFVDVLHVDDDVTAVTFTSDAFVGGSSSEYRGEIVGGEDKTARAYVAIDDVEPGEYEVTADFGDAGSDSFTLVVEEPSEGKINIKLAVLDEDAGLLDLQVDPISRGGLSAEFRTKLGDAHDKWYPFEYDQEQGSARQDLRAKDPRPGEYQVHVRVQFHGGYSEIVTGMVTIPEDLQDDDESATEESTSSEGPATSDDDTSDQEQTDDTDDTSADAPVADDIEPEDGFLAAKTDNGDEHPHEGAVAGSADETTATDTKSAGGFLPAGADSRSSQDAPGEPETADQQNARTADTATAENLATPKREGSDETATAQPSVPDQRLAAADGPQPPTQLATGQSEGADEQATASDTDLPGQADESAQDSSDSTEQSPTAEVNNSTQQDSSANDNEDTEQREPDSDTGRSQEMNR